MRPRTVLILLLVVASVLVDLAMSNVADSDHVPLWPTLVLNALSVSQVGLLSAWAAIGRKWWPFRVTAVLAVCAGWDWLTADADSIELQGNWLILLGIESAIVILLLGAMRILGLRIINITDIRGASESSPRKLTQFNITDYFTTTFAVGGLLAVFGSATVNREAWSMLLYWEPLAAPMVASLTWVMLSRANCVVRIVAFITSVGVGYTLCLLPTWPPTAEMVVPSSIFFAALTGLLFASLLVIRVAGYRLATTAPFGLPPIESETSSAAAP